MEIPTTDTLELVENRFQLSVRANVHVMNVVAAQPENVTQNPPFFSMLLIIKIKEFDYEERELGTTQTVFQSVHLFLERKQRTRRTLIQVPNQRPLLQGL
jgi:hypothetical protein